MIEEIIIPPAESTRPVPVVPLQMSPEIDKIAGALCKAQGMMKHPKKNKTAVVPLLKGGNYSYDYADLADVLDALREPFATNGIAIVQVPYIDRLTFDSTCVGVVTLLMHESGQWIMGQLAMPVADAKPQSIGSVITYLRRYMAGPMGGIASDVDDDGSAAEGNHGQTQQRQRQPAKAATQGKAPDPAKMQTAKESAPVMTGAELQELDLAVCDFRDAWSALREANLPAPFKDLPDAIIKMPIARIKAATALLQAKVKEQGK